MKKTYILILLVLICVDFCGGIYISRHNVNWLFKRSFKEFFEFLEVSSVDLKTSLILNYSLLSPISQQNSFSSKEISQETEIQYQIGVNENKVTSTTEEGIETTMAISEYKAESILPLDYYTWEDILDARQYQTISRTRDKWILSINSSKLDSKLKNNVESEMISELNQYLVENNGVTINITAINFPESLEVTLFMNMKKNEVQAIVVKTEEPITVYFTLTGSVIDNSEMMANALGIPTSRESVLTVDLFEYKIEVNEIKKTESNEDLSNKITLFLLKIFP